MKTRASFGIASIAVLCAACGSTHGSDFANNNGNGNGGLGDGGSQGSLPENDGGPASSGTDGPGEVFGHSADTLYKLEPFSMTVTTIGKFSCVDIPCNMGEGMWDIALDKDGNMYGSVAIASGACDGSMSGAIVKIDKTTASCSVVGTSSSAFPNSLSFVPAGTIDPTNEVLVGYNEDTYLRIDPSSGTTTNIGSLNPNSTGQNWYSSGDIVSIIGGKTYLTASTTNDGTGGDDSILEVDPVHGTALKVIGSIGAGHVWGLGFWAGTAYGFDDGGQLLTIDLTTGAGTPVALSGSLSGLSFYGAGNTTAAPVNKPR